MDSATTSLSEPIVEPIVVQDGDKKETLTPWRETAVVVSSDDEYREVGARVVATQAYLDKVLLYWNGSPAKLGPVALAHATWKDLCDKRAAFTKPAEAQLKADKAALDGWAAEKERIARELAAEEEARRRARAEQDVLDAAVQLASTGDPLSASVADQLLDTPVETAPAYVAPALPSVAGLRGATNRFSVTVEDQRLVILAAAAGEMVLAMATAKLPPRDKKVIHEWLQQFQPAPGAMEYAFKADAVDKVGVERVARRQGEKFKLAGVTAGRNKKH